MEKKNKHLTKNSFQFKQFSVLHDKCAMKVSTDSILLGCWAQTDNPSSILDIGTGCGLLALMLAQRYSKALIDAIELDEDAYLQAKDNFHCSVWAPRLQAISGDVIQYEANCTKHYDLIISNPPYFEEGVACRSVNRNKARYTSTLSHQQLLSVSHTLLSPTGILSLVLPYSSGRQFLLDAQECGWFVGRQLSVCDSINKPAHLLLLELSKQPLKEDKQQLTIRQINRQYTNEFCQLTKAFYLSF